MSAGGPQIAVVIPTHERPTRLAQLLAALADQTISTDALEVVVVDDASGPATAEVLECYLGPRVDVRVLRAEPAIGPARARNRGWQAARAPYIAFTDDDCIPTPGWLEALRAAAATRPGAVVQGRTLPDPAEVRDGSRVLARSVEVEAAGPQYETCNILYPRELLAALGGFDEGYGRYPAGEDTDLALRALEAGRRVVFAPDALVHHAIHRLSPSDGMRDALRWSACAQLVARHPVARGMLYHRVFWNVWHYLLVRSVLACLGPRWLRRLVLRRHLSALLTRARSLGSGPTAVPYLLLFDIVETTAMIRGAVRHRTPLL